MTSRASYATTRKARNTGQWWLPKQQQVLHRKSVRRHFAHWNHKAHHPQRYPNGTGDVPQTPHPDRLAHVFMRHINSWGAGPALTRPINLYA